MIDFILLIIMTSIEIQTVSEMIAFHPPIIIGTLCIFMYIRGRILHSKLHGDVLLDSKQQ